MHGHGKYLIRIGESDHEPLPEWHGFVQFLGQAHAHKRIAQIDDELGQRHLGQSSPRRNDTDAGELVCAGHIGNAHDHPLDGAQSRGHHGDAKAETDRDDY